MYTSVQHIVSPGSDTINWEFKILKSKIIYFEYLKFYLTLSFNDLHMLNSTFMCTFKHNVRILVVYQNYFKSYMNWHFDLRIFSGYGLGLMVLTWWKLMQLFTSFTWVSFWPWPHRGHKVESQKAHQIRVQTNRCYL